jgi:hypothetical protein
MLQNKLRNKTFPMPTRPIVRCKDTSITVQSSLVVITTDRTCKIIRSMYISSAPLPQFPAKVTLDRDCYVAHKMAAISCLMERYVASCLTQQEIMLQSETCLR